MCAKRPGRIGNPQRPQNCLQVHTKIAPDQFAQYVARATKFPTGLPRERSVYEREIFYAAFGCQRTTEHYRNIPELSSWVVVDRTVTRRRGGTMEGPPHRAITKSRRSGYDPTSSFKTHRGVINLDHRCGPTAKAAKPTKRPPSRSKHRRVNVGHALDHAKHEKALRRHG